MARTMCFVILMLLLVSAAMAQVPEINDPVLLEVDPPALQQGTMEVGIPEIGDYSILVNGWIGPYAAVSAYDNWIDFGIMSPTSGTFSDPAVRWAFSQTGETNPFLGFIAGENGGQDPLYEVNGSTMDFDLAGIRIETNSRLNLAMSMGGYMRRCSSTGVVLTDWDTRRTDGGFYELRNQVKIALHGKFLQYNGADDPLPGAAGTAYSSPTSGEPTAYNTWTAWSSGVNAIPTTDPVVGWFEPVGAINDPWTGSGAAYATDGGRANIDFIDLVVERGQAGPHQEGGVVPGAAEVWFTQRVLRRGLQDRAGNYRADMSLFLTYREAEVQWIPETYVPPTSP